MSKDGTNRGGARIGLPSAGRGCPLRLLPLAHLASSATGGARIAPPPSYARRSITRRSSGAHRISATKAKRTPIGVLCFV